MNVQKGVISLKKIRELPELVWRAVQDFLGKDRWPFKPTQIHKQLNEQGIKHETSDDGDRLTCRRTAGRRNVRVLVFEKVTFDAFLTADTPKKPKEIGDHELGIALDQAFVN